MGNTIFTSANLEIAEDLNIVENEGISFGIASSDAAGTIDANGNTTGGVTSNSATHPATLTVTGKPNAVVNVTISSNSGTITDGTNNLSVSYTLPAAITLDGTGSKQFIVGGVATVPASSANGTYAGSVPEITVAYQV